MTAVYVITEKTNSEMTDNLQDRLTVLSNVDKFPCSKCGACCRRAGKRGIMPDRGDGACVHLTKENTCAIYETRPDQCNYELMYQKAKSNFPEITRQEHFKSNAAMCNMFMDSDDMPESFRIDMSIYEKVK